MQFPAIAVRLEHCVRVINAKYGFTTPFGLFWNLCINAPVGPVQNVCCDAHVDSKNGALLMCAVFVYYYGQGTQNIL
jgi:hypothetical protein